MEINFKYTVGKRIDSRLVYTTDDRQLFKVKRTERTGAKTYYCYKKGCSAKISIKDGICVRVPKSEVHNHDNQEDDYEQFMFKDIVKLRSQSDQGSEIQDIFSEERQAIQSADHYMDLPNYNQVKSSMIYHRKKAIPKNPTSYEDIQTFFADKYVENILKTECGTRKFYQGIISNEEFTYVVFGFEQILNSLPEIRHFNITSMHVTSIGFFKVLVTISVIKLNEVSN